MTWLLALRALPWKVIGFSALGLALVLMFAALKMERAHSARLKAQIAACSEGRKADRASYEQAQKLAAESNKLQVQRIEQEQGARSNAIQSRWNTDRARLAELMRKAPPAAPGSAQGPGAGPVPDPAGGPDGVRVCLVEGDALSAARNELRLFYLQEWVREQLKVRR